MWPKFVLALFAPVLFILCPNKNQPFSHQVLWAKILSNLGILFPLSFPIPNIILKDLNNFYLLSIAIHLILFSVICLSHLNSKYSPDYSGWELGLHDLKNEFWNQVWSSDVLPVKSKLLKIVTFPFAERKNASSLLKTLFL